MKSRKRARSLLIFERKTDGDDGFGPNPAAGEWEDAIGFPLGAELKPARGNESQVNSVVRGTQIYNARIRAAYVEKFGIDVTWRARESKDGGKVFNISAVATDDNDYKWSNLTLVFGEIP